MKVAFPFVVALAAGVAVIVLMIINQPTYAPPNAKAAPYYYNDDAAVPPSATEIRDAMTKSGITVFTLAFVLASDNGCDPRWSGDLPLSDDEHPSDEKNNKMVNLINAIRGNGGDVQVSFGGATGTKLELACSDGNDATAVGETLANAYQKVIDKYGLKYIDVDAENDPTVPGDQTFNDPDVQARILGALKIIKQNNPKVTTILTFSALWRSDTINLNNDDYALNLIKKAHDIGANVDVFTIMPFDFNRGTDMTKNTIDAANDLKAVLGSVFGWLDGVAYAHIGISGMNGKSDKCAMASPDDICEITYPPDWIAIRNWATSNKIARLSFWSVNRDRACDQDQHADYGKNCSGISQSEWQFMTVTAGFKY